MTDKVDVTRNLSPEEKRRLLARLLRQKVEAGRGWEPLSHAQRLYWVLQQAAPADTPVNHEGFVWRVPGDFDFGLFLRMIGSVVERHPGMRTIYNAVDGVPLQRFGEPQPLRPEIIDADSWTVERLNEQIVAAASRPFDLITDPLFRVQFFKRGKSEGYVATTVHHLSIDLWSMVLVMEELKSCYLGQLMGEPQKLATPQRHYRDFVAWQEQLVRGPQGQRLQEFWDRQLERPPGPMELPTDRARPRRSSYHGSTSTLALGPELTARVRMLARTEQTTLFQVLLAAFQVVLARWSGQEDFFVATRGAGRTRAEFEGVVGCFTNTLPLRADLSGNPTFRQLLERVSRTLGAALEHQDYPFALLAQRHAITRPGEPLCDVCFVLQRPYRMGSEPEFRQGSSSPIRSQATSGALFALGESRVDVLPINFRVARYDLELEMFDAGEVLNGWMRYRTDLFDAPTIERMLREIEDVLEEATAN